MGDNKFDGEIPLASDQQEKSKQEHRMESLIAEITADLKAALDQHQAMHPYDQGWPVDVLAVIQDCWDQFSDKHGLPKVQMEAGMGEHANSVGVLKYDLPLYANTSAYLPEDELPAEFSKRLIQKNIDSAIKMISSG